METLVIWSATLATALLVVALATALAARLPRPAGTALIAITVIALAAPVLFFDFVAFLSRPWAFVTTLGFAAGAVAIVWQRGRAATWPLARLAIVFGLSLIILVTSARNARLTAQQMLQTRRAELASLEQLLWPGVPDASNAAPLYARAYEKIVPMDAVPDARAAFEAVWTKDAAPTQPALGEWLRRNDGALAFALEGAQRPGYASLEDAIWRGNPIATGREGKILRLEMSRTGHDPSTVDNELSRRRIGDLLQTRALRRAAEGDSARAAQDANALFALADQTSSPWLRPERLAQRLLETKGFDPRGLRVPRGEGEVARLRRMLIRSEHASLAFGNRFYESRDPLDLVFKEVHEALWAQAWIARTEKAYDELWEAAYAPPAQRLARFRAVANPPGPVRFFEDPWVARVAEGLERGLREEALRACALAGVAAAQYRAAHGALPASLDDFDVPKDPFTGGPVRYERAAAGAKVSAGDQSFLVP